MQLTGEMIKKFRKLSAVLMTADYRSAWLRNRVAATVEHEVPLRGLGLATIVDIGANKGQFALFAAHTFKNAAVHSFEPLNRPAERFMRTLGNQARITLYRSAIGAESGSSQMHVARRDDSSSLLPITTAQVSNFRGTDEVRTEVVRVSRLDEFLCEEMVRLPALLKLDVQGYEMQALLGCEDLLHRFQYVYLEVSFLELYKGQSLADDLIVWLHSRNFRMKSVHGVQSNSRGEAIQADVLFERCDE
ncbi:FkbM family methyltransferase [Mycobacterium sp. BK558]|nr:FkbM family methyltransferase [Mycobacterium sp. BK558]